MAAAARRPEEVGTAPIEPPWRPALRALVSFAIALIASGLIWRSVPSALSVRTTTVGYSTFANFNVNRYTDAYLLIAFGFPIIAALTYAVVSRIGPMRRRTRASIGFLPIGEVGLEVADRPTAPFGGARSSTSFWLDAFWSAGRLALVALVVGLELSVSQSPTQAGISSRGYLGAFSFVVAVLGLGLLLHRRSRTRSATSNDGLSRQEALTSISRVNAAGRVGRRAGSVPRLAGHVPLDFLQWPRSCTTRGSRCGWPSP